MFASNASWLFLNIEGQQFANYLTALFLISLPIISRLSSFPQISNISPFDLIAFGTKCTYYSTSLPSPAQGPGIFHI